MVYVTYLTCEVYYLLNKCFHDCLLFYFLVLALVFTIILLLMPKVR